ncbi:MAG: hypothetical protein ABSA21_11110 [Candidatus Limnocylindrales bacterium]
MRRLLCIASLLSRLAGQTYVWRVAPLHRPVPIVRSLPAETLNGTLPAWWLAR